ncbi:hypothetical protein MVEN_01555900 [Mycena venus]|uniref:DUF7730 domain-containing protein n=1 Tax=Mycena venus TaxID=2733690 RepID=A0A8H6XS92_9AGAR|nr:hypothetical protein MVEN_01555900 [Mycena venus]
MKVLLWLFASAVRKAATWAALSPLLVLCSPYLALRYIKRRRRRGGVGCVIRMEAALRYPSPLPTDRIDIESGAVVEQPRCHLLQLPPELRALIFQLAVGNRLVHIAVPNHNYDRYIIQTTCYVPPEPPGTPYNLRLLELADNISVALLLTCRSAYVELLPIMHRQNIFYFWLQDLPDIFHSSLGQYCLPKIRAVYIYQNHCRAIAQWSPVFDLLQKMCLESLTLEFDALNWSGVPQFIFSLDSPWCRGLLGVRHLRNLDIFFASGRPEDPQHPETVTQTLRDLMIGPAADEKYETLFERPR